MCLLDCKHLGATSEFRWFRQFFYSNYTCSISYAAKPQRVCKSNQTTLVLGALTPTHQVRHPKQFVPLQSTQKMDLHDTHFQESNRPLLSTKNTKKKHIFKKTTENIIYNSLIPPKKAFISKDFFWINGWYPTKLVNTSQKKGFSDADPAPYMFVQLQGPPKVDARMTGKYMEAMKLW